MVLRNLESSGRKAESEFNGEINDSNMISPIMLEKYTKFNERREDKVLSCLDNSCKV